MDIKEQIKKLIKELEHAQYWNQRRATYLKEQIETYERHADGELNKSLIKLDSLLQELEE